MLVEWLVSIGSFWIAAVAYLGTFPTEIEGGSGLRQVIGLLLSYAVFFGVWWLLHAVLGGFAGVIGGVIVPTVLSVALYPLIAWVAFMPVGVRIRWGSETPH